MSKKFQFMKSYTNDQLSPPLFKIMLPCQSLVHFHMDIHISAFCQTAKETFHTCMCTYWSFGYLGDVHSMNKPFHISRSMYAHAISSTQYNV